MTSPGTFIAGDWGTSHLRLFLCRGSEILDSRDGPGIGVAQTSPATVLFDLVAPWTSAHGKLPLWLAGMIGSRNGWRETPYVPCPAGADALAAAMVRFSSGGHEVAIAAGVSCTNACGAPDFMRGEETQIIGALTRHPELAIARQVVILPGTHTKWVQLDDGCITSFHTSLSGELYALLQNHSMLLRVPTAVRDAPGAGDETEGFALGLARSRDHAAVPLTHLLFEVRSRQLTASLKPEQARGFLSGLIIGTDVLGGKRLFDNALRSRSKVALIGTGGLARAYHAALATHGIDALIEEEGSELTVDGLRVVASRVRYPDEPRAAVT